jgi:hypothetical protein
MQPARLRKILSLLCPALSSLFLAIGYPLSGGWAAAGVGLTTFVVWLAVRRWSSTWTASLGLVVSTAAAAIGVTTGGLSAWLLISAALSLASWDLILLDASLANNSPPILTGRLDEIHYRYLALALGSGLLVGLAGRMVHFHIPFILMLLLVGLIYFSLDRLVRVLIH